MENQKLLTLAMPTYNRASFLKENLTGIIRQIKGLEDQIELLVSNNCSTDDTEEVVQEFIAQGAPISYNCNTENLGADRNFIYCFRHATAKYVWILGDDDYLLDETIPRLIEIMQRGDYGLIHLKTNARENEFKYKVYTDTPRFLGKISFWITFISANIIRTKHVAQVDLERYVGSDFLQVPPYLNAALSETEQVMVLFKTMNGGQAAITNGGYNIFEVFVTNYLSILQEFRERLGYRWYEVEKFHLCWNFLRKWLKKLIVKPNHDMKFRTDRWFEIIFRAYWYEPYFYFMLPVVFAKKYVLRSVKPAKSRKNC